MYERFFYDFTNHYKGGGVAEVEPLYWYTRYDEPHVVLLVVESSGNPKAGEVVWAKVGRELTCKREADPPSVGFVASPRGL